MKVRCIEAKNWKGELSGSSWLKVGGIYHVLMILTEPGRTMLRLIGEEPSPALFQPEIFEVVSSVIPGNWVIRSTRPGFLELGPAAWTGAGFWEDYFDRKAEAVACFEDEKRKIIEADPF